MTNTEGLIIVAVVAVGMWTPIIAMSVSRLLDSHRVSCFRFYWECQQRRRAFVAIWRGW